MSAVELWFRPWALADISGRHRVDLAGGSLCVDSETRGPPWVYVPSGTSVVVNGSQAGGEKVVGFDHASGTRALFALPLPLKRRSGVTVRVEGLETHIQWPSLPDRPAATLSPQTDDEQAAYTLFMRAQAVWDRLQDVDSALGDPERLWEELRRRWTSNDRSEPQMDIIVHHAANMRQTLEELEARATANSQAHPETCSDLTSSGT